MELSTHDECLVTDNICGKQSFYAGFMRGATTSSISFRYHGRGLAACRSMPPINIAYSSGVSLTLTSPALTAGQRKHPRCNRLHTPTAPSRPSRSVSADCDVHYKTKIHGR